MRPYQTLGFTYRNYSVDMIGHDHEFIYLHPRADDFCIRPFLLNYPAREIQRYFFINHVAKLTFSTFGTDRDKVGPRLGIVISSQAYGPALMNFGIVIHIR